MLSIENPPGPSCPSKASALTTDERASDQHAFQGADTVGLGETQAPNFSIRDYVFTSRNKDIATNWPFPQQFLQLCLKHGVRELLPPFEPPVDVRARCCRKAVESEQLVTFSGAEKISVQFESLEIKDIGPVDKEAFAIEPNSCFRSDELVVSCLDQAQYPLSETVDRGDILDDKPTKDNAEIVSKVTNNDRTERTSDQISEPHRFSEALSEVEVAKPHPVPSKLETLCDPSEKKCRLIVKSGAITETSGAEDIVSTCTTVSDPMASKVCPVCKIFSSSSNTTLNAHIDQCLSAESNIKHVMTKIPTPKVKPKKKRLMVDIYATAPRCTIEDLDRRNGTNWVTELTLIARANEAYTEIKRPKLSPIDTKADGNEGAVFVDSNGIKVCSLSKFNDTPPLISREHFKMKKHAHEEGKSLLIDKKKSFTSKYQKFTKLKPTTKKLNSFKSFKGEIQAAPEGDQHAYAHEKEESPSEMLNAQEQLQSSGSATLRHWVCSKRSDLPKRLNHKDIHYLDNSLISRSRMVESDQPDVRNPTFVKGRILKVSRPSEDLASFPKSKRVDSLSNTTQFMGNGKKESPKPLVFNSKCLSESTSTNCLTLKIRRSLGTSISSPRKRDKICMSTTQKPVNSSETTITPSERCHLPLKVKKSSTMEKNDLVGRPSFASEGSKGDASDTFRTCKKFRKNRSVLETGKQGELPSDVYGGLSRSTKHSGLDTARATKTIRIRHRSDLSESITRSTTEEIMDQLTIDKQKYNTSNSRHPGTELHDPEIETSGMQVEALARVNIVTELSMEKDVDDHVSSDTVVSENLAIASNAKLDLRPPVEEKAHSLCASEALIEPTAEQLCDDQEIRSCDVTCDEVVIQSIQVADEVELRWELDNFAAQHTECQAESVSVDESSGCLTNHGDAILEIPHENSSITSIRMASDQNQILGIDREPTGSPDSTASTVSPPSPKDSEFKDSKEEPVMKPTVRDELGLTVPRAASIDGAERRNIEERNHEVQECQLAKKPELSDDQPCCCSWRDGIRRGSEFLSQNVMAGMRLPSNGKQISNLYTVPSISSSSSYPSSKIDATGSIATKETTDSTVKVPACIGFSSPSPSPRTRAQSNSILRLMGKNLMVTNTEEPQLPILDPSDSENPSNTQCSPPPGFATTSWESISYHHHHQLPGGSAVFGRVPSMVNQLTSRLSTNMRAGCFTGPLQASARMELDQEIHHNLNKKPNSPSASHRHHQNHASSSQANMMKEMTMIDGSPEFESKMKCDMRTPIGVLPAVRVSNPTQQRPFSCLPSQSQFLSGEFSSGFRAYPNACPRDYDNSIKRGKTSEGSDPLPLRPFEFRSPSTGHLRPSLHYSQALQ